MVPQDRGDAIYTFLTDLRSAREAKQRLLELAVQDPQKVLAFESAAAYLDTETRQLYEEVKVYAQKALSQTTD